MISSNVGNDLKRSVGVNGRNSFSAITVQKLNLLSSDKIDFFAFRQSDDGFLPSRSSAHGSPDSFLLTRVVTGIHVDHLLLKEAFDRALDLNFVCTRTHAKDILVLLLAHDRRLLSQRGGLNDVVRLVHRVISLLRRFVLGGSALPIFPTPSG